MKSSLPFELKVANTRALHAIGPGQNKTRKGAMRLRSERIAALVPSDAMLVAGVRVSLE